MDLPTDRAFVTVETAARYLGIGRTMAYDLARRGEFPAPVIRAGRRYLVPVEALRRLAQGLPPVPKEITVGPTAMTETRSPFAQPNHHGAQSVRGRGSWEK